VVNFDVPGLAEDYVHRVGRTGRAQATGDALTLVSPQENSDFTRIERMLGLRVPRVQLEGFDYNARPEAKLEVSITERIAGIREQKARERANRARNEQGVQRPAAHAQDHAHGDAPRLDRVRPHRVGSGRRPKRGYGSGAPRTY
jgi:ATP-dependent RNA helicase RhlE